MATGGNEYTGSNSFEPGFYQCAAIECGDVPRGCNEPSWIRGELECGTDTCRRISDRVNRPAGWRDHLWRRRQLQRQGGWDAAVQLSMAIQWHTQSRRNQDYAGANECQQHAGGWICRRDHK